jgi:hypothetical protein
MMRENEELRRRLDELSAGSADRGGATRGGERSGDRG